MCLLLWEILYPRLSTYSRHRKKFKRIRNKALKEYPEIVIDSVKQGNISIPYFYVKNVSSVALKMVYDAYRDGQLVRHSTQDPNKLYFMISEDHFENTTAIQLSLLNVLKPVSPKHFHIIGYIEIIVFLSWGLTLQSIFFIIKFPVCKYLGFFIIMFLSL